jgi:hypothetical protein
MTRKVQTVSLSSEGTSNPVEISVPHAPATWNDVGLLLTFSSGATARATVEISGDSEHWNPHDDLVGKRASANGKIEFPVSWARLRLWEWVSGTVTLTVIQVSNM